MCDLARDGGSIRSLRQRLEQCVANERMIEAIDCAALRYDETLEEHHVENVIHERIMSDGRTQQALFESHAQKTHAKNGTLRCFEPRAENGQRGAYTTSEDAFDRMRFEKRANGVRRLRNEPSGRFLEHIGRLPIAHAMHDEKRCVLR